jgi:catechol 2,3-dioxygenase-like lactoylglutathione lyase family enzyme
VTLGLAQQPAQLAHFHHIHLNAANPEASLNFYSTRFNGKRSQLTASVEGIWASRLWLLFDKAPRPAPAEIVSPLYHIGWGAPDGRVAYDRLVDLGVNFETPMSDLSDLLGTGSPGNGWYMYAEGPDRELIEINRSNNYDFQHFHLLSDDPVGAAQWYAKEFGFPMRGTPSREARSHKGVQVAPLVFMNVDGVLFGWFPTGAAKGLYPDAWKARTGFASPRGRNLDHFALSVDNLNDSLARLERDGVRILEPPSLKMNGAFLSAFVEAPDNVALEIVEGHAARDK